MGTYPLRKYPTQITLQEQLKLIKFIDKKLSFEDLLPLFELSEPDLIKEIVTFIRLGFLFTKRHLFHLVQLTEADFTYIREQSTTDDIISDDLNEIKDKYANYKPITDLKLHFTLQYLRVRNRLNYINVPYYDVDLNELHNIDKLLDIKDVQRDSITNKLNAFDRLASLPKANSSLGSSSSTNIEPIKRSEDIIAEIMASFEVPKKATIDNKTESQLSTLNSRVENVSKVKPGRERVVAPTGWIQTKPVKRTAMTIKSKVQYLDSSESDSEENRPPAVKKSSSQSGRVLPQWMSSKGSSQERRN